MKKVLSVLLLLVGLTSIILGIVCFGKEIGYWESSKAYGGDAYTGIQNAAAQAANNVWYANKILCFGFGSILLVAGLALDIVAINGFIPEKKSKEMQSTAE